MIMKRFTLHTAFLILLLMSLGTHATHAQWQQTNGPYGGTIYALAVSPAAGGTGGTNLSAFASDKGRQYIANEKTMGTFSVTLEVGSLTSSKVLRTDALVDTGATHTLISQSVLRGLGVEPIDRILFQLAHERTVEYDVGQIRLKLDGRERIVLVVFGEDNASALLGATTLEVFNLAVDPVQRRLVPVPGLLKALTANPPLVSPSEFCGFTVSFRFPQAPSDPK